jgi:transposase
VTAREREALDDRLQANPRLAQGSYVQERFQALLAQRNLGAFDRGRQEAEQSGRSSFQAVVQGCRHDDEPIKAAVVSPWRTGQCEGQLCRVTLLKRQGYGHATLDGLRQRIWPRSPVASPAAQPRDGCMDRAIA